MFFFSISNNQIFGKRKKYVLKSVTVGGGNGK